MKPVTVFQVLAILFLASNLCFSQSTENHSIGINIKPNYLIPEKKIETLNETSNSINYSVGIVYSKPFTERVRLVTGLYYSQISFNQKDYSPAWGSDHNGAGGFDQFASWKQDVYKSNYVAIPIELNYILINKKNKLFAKIGYELMLNVGNKLESVHYVSGLKSETNASAQNLDNNNLGKVKLGLGYEIKLKNSYSIILEPEFEYYVYDIYKDNSLYSNRPVSFGLNAKFMFGMGKNSVE